MKILRTIKYSDSYINYINQNYPNFNLLDYDKQRKIIFDEYYGWGDSWDNVLNGEDGLTCTTFIIGFPGHTEKFSGNGTNLMQVVTALNKTEADILIVFDKGFSEININYLRVNVPKLKLICKWVGLGYSSTKMPLGYDIILTCLKSNIEFYGKKGFKCYYFQSFSDSRLINRVKKNCNNKILFCGSLNSFEGGHFRRAEILYQLTKKYNVDYHIAELNFKSIIKLSMRLLYKIFKLNKKSLVNLKYIYYYIYLLSINKMPLYGKAYYSALISSRLVINVDIDSAANESANLRLYECITLGARLVTDFKFNIAHLFDYESIYPFDNLNNILEVIENLPYLWTPHLLYGNNFLDLEIRKFSEYLRNYFLKKI